MTKIKIPIPFSNYEIKSHDPASAPPVDGTQQWSLGPLKLKRKTAPPRAQTLPNVPTGPALGDFVTRFGLDPGALTQPAAAPATLDRWAGLPFAVVQELRSFAGLKARRGGPLKTAMELAPTALAIAEALPRQANPIDRGNAMRWLDAYLSLGRKHFAGLPHRRADVMAQQARVWEALMDLLPALAGDRTTQYAILFRLKRETDTGPDQPPFVPPQLQDTYERLLALMRRTDDKGPVLRENSRPLARLLLARLGPPGQAPRATALAPPVGSVDHAIATLPPLTPAEAARYSQDIADNLAKLREAKATVGMSAPLLYSLGRHLPGLQPMMFDAAEQLGQFLRDFPSGAGHVFGIIARGDTPDVHVTGVIAKRHAASPRSSDTNSARQALWYLDSSAGYLAVIDREFQSASASSAGSQKALTSATALQEDGHSCGAITMSLLSKSFRHFEETDGTLERVKAEGRIRSYAYPISPDMQLLGGPVSLVELHADHAKHLQDKSNSGKLAVHVITNPGMGRSIVNKKLQTVQARYFDPDNIRRVTNADGALQTHSLSASRTFQRMVDRARADLEALQRQPDGGAHAWREACLRMAPMRLPDGGITDRLVGIRAHPQLLEEREAEIDRARGQLKAFGPNSIPGNEAYYNAQAFFFAAYQRGEMDDSRDAPGAGPSGSGG